MFKSKIFAVEWKWAECEKKWSNTVSYIVARSMYMHTYIHNWAWQLFRKNYNHASNATYVVSVNLIQVYSRLRTLYSWETFLFVYRQQVCQKSAERISPKKYFFIFRFGAWTGKCIRIYSNTSKNPTHYLWGYGDFNIHIL